MSQPDTAHRPVLAALASHPVLVTATVLATTGVALVIAVVQPTTYTAEARLAVAGGDLAAQAVPGYALASQELAANYARYVNNSDDQGALEQQVGVRAGSISAVAASPVPESNVVRIEVEAVDGPSAVAGAAAVAETLVDRVEAASTEQEAAAVLTEFTTISTAVAEAEQEVARSQEAVAGASAAGPSEAVEAARAAAATAAAELSVLRVQQEALGQRYRTLVDTVSSVDLTVVQPAEVTANDRAPRAQQYALGGLTGGFLLALGLVRRQERRATRSAGAPEDSAPVSGAPTAGAPAAREDHRTLLHATSTR